MTIQLSAGALQLAVAPFAFEYIEVRAASVAYRIHDAVDNAVGSCSNLAEAEHVVKGLNAVPRASITEILASWELQTKQPSLKPPRTPSLYGVALSPAPGTILREVAALAQRLADDLSTDVSFRFNGFTLIAKPKGSAEALELRYEVEAKLPSLYRLSCITSTGEPCSLSNLCQKEENRNG